MGKNLGKWHPRPKLVLWKIDFPWSIISDWNYGSIFGFSLGFASCCSFARVTWSLFYHNVLWVTFILVILFTVLLVRVLFTLFLWLTGVGLFIFVGFLFWFFYLTNFGQKFLHLAHILILRITNFGTEKYRQPLQGLLLKSPLSLAQQSPHGQQPPIIGIIHRFVNTVRSKEHQLITQQRFHLGLSFTVLEIAVQKPAHYFVLFLLLVHWDVAQLHVQSPENESVVVLGCDLGFS